MTEFLSDDELSSLNNYTALFSQAPAPIAIYKGRELRYVFVNAAYSKIFNQRSILGKTVREAFPELEGQPYFGILERVFDTGVPFHGIETPALIDLNNDGHLTTAYYNLIYTPYTNGQGKIVGVMAFGHDVTDQVEARNRERESELRFRNIVEQSIDPIFILKGQELVLDVANKALLSLWNVGNDAVGKPFLEILPEMKDQGFHELMLKVYHTGSTHYGHETRAYFKRTNGDIETLYFDFIYQPYREADGSISGVLVLATDVTGKVLAKQNLAHSETNFRNMILQAPVAMCVLKGPNRVVEIANAHMYELWGRPEIELLHRPLFEGLPEAKNQGFEKLLEDVYTTGTRFVANERPVALPRNGNIETRYTNFVCEPFRQGDGSISGIIAVATDVTEQIIARHKIEVAEENMRLAIESADLGTYESNLLTNELFTSARFKDILGLETDSTNPAEITSVIHENDRSIRRKAHEQAIISGNLHYEVRIKRKDESERWVRVKGKVLYDKQGTPERLLGVLQDITEQKLFAEELSKKVDERTKSLQQTNEQLERSNAELEQFAYIASHDLQEPLRKISFFNSMVVEQKGLTDESKRYIEKVSESATRMTGLIRDLLEYSKLSQKSMQFQRTDLGSILESVLIDYELLIAQKGAIVNMEALAVVDAMPLQMNQLFFNLIGNALKFTRRNVVPVITILSNRLDTKRKSEMQLTTSKEYYEIKITDNGIGFNQDYADKIFTIFQRLNERSIYGGYGIGLALCRKIVLNHNGIIYAEGSPGKGASFSFVLPCLQNDF